MLRDLTGEVFANIKGQGLAQPLTGSQYGVPFTTNDDVEQCRAIWRIFAEAIRDFTGPGKLFSGVVGGPELAVQLDPLQVLPHANYVAWSSGLCEQDLRTFRRVIRRAMRNCRAVMARVYPAIASYRLRSSDDVGRVLSYARKPIDIVRPYVNAAE